MQQLDQGTLRVSAGARRYVCVFALAVIVSLAFGVAAQAHILHNDGSWTYRYLTRKSQSYCGGSSGSSDPLNVLFWQYGEGGRMNSHAEADTHWGFYSGPRDSQWICGDSNANPGNYSVDDSTNFDDQEGHGGIWCLCLVRAHFRIFRSPHSHENNVDKWSTIDVHHEHVTVSSSTVFTHYIDEDWEKWEQHIGSEFGGAGHNYWHDYWARQGGQYIQGFWDDGYITRVGGLHNGVY
jgi:hypothetical protein